EHLITYEMQNGSCSDSETIVITVGAAPDIDISVTDATSSESSDGSATASASGGLSPYEYYWSNGDTDATMENVPAGNYSVMVTDAAGCVSSAPVHIDFLNSMDEENSPGFIVYPNPAENKIFVKTKNMQAEKIELINTLGQSLLVRDVHSDVEFFDVTHIGSGIYFIRINTKDTAYIQKVVIGGR
ncbi:MAG: T9SS type A sorting domain-containing protein, partial [Bacteroidota bacterium]